MAEQMIICPHCGQQTPLSEAVIHELRNEMETEIRQQLEDDNSQVLNDLKRQLNEEKDKRKAAQAAELEVRQEREQLQEEIESWELEKQRELDAAREEIREVAFRSFAEQQQFKDEENRLMIAGLQHQVAELNQKIEQGSQQMQGEVLELVLEDFLRQKFPSDEIMPVPKGVVGADIMQRVHDDHNHICGQIIWESKRTKNWSDEWCGKLQEDQQHGSAEVAILVTKALPREIRDFGYLKGIWVTNQACIYSLAMAMRMSLIQISAVRRAAENKGGKIEDLYDYLTSQAFEQRIHAIVDYFDGMKKIWIWKSGLSKNSGKSVKPN